MQMQITTLRTKVQQANMPSDLRSKLVDLMDRLDYVMRSGNAGSFMYFDEISNYIEWVTHLPWNKESVDTLDIAAAKRIFDKNHYGLDDIKHRILEYLAVIMLQRKHHDFTPLKGGAPSQLRAPILCFVGLVGTGKTTMAVSLAEALNRQLIRIPFGGLASALDLRGLSRVHPEAEPGLIIRSLRRVNVRNPVILLDELDRVSDDKRGEIMGVLVELLDPAQNQAFVDHYVDYPFNLSQAIFVATANNVNKVATAVLDRMEVIQMPSYTDEEKLHIAKEYLLPRAITAAGLTEDMIKVEADVWPHIVRPLGFDSGIRTLNRNVESIVRKCAWKLLNREATSFTISVANYREYLE